MTPVGARRLRRRGSGGGEFPTGGGLAARCLVVLTIGKLYAGDGWRYLWDQVVADPAGYYLSDVERGEAPGRWGGHAAKAELGLSGQVGEADMRALFGRLAHPRTGEQLGRPLQAFRSVADRLDAARATHDERWAARWAQREVTLAAGGVDRSRIDAEMAAFRAAGDERWAATEATIRRAGQRRAVAGYDLTFSAPKSVSVLWAAAPPESRQTILSAHHEGVAAAMAYVETEAARSRSGYRGVRQVDTTGLVTASFDHRTSRAGDVHVHTHVATLNRVRCDDGAWRALDGGGIYRVAAAAGAVYDHVREAALERDLGVTHAPDPVTAVREVVGVDPAVRRLFSTRRVQIEGRLAKLVDTWALAHGGAPSAWQKTRMAEWARLETRARKGDGESTADALTRWDAGCRSELGRSLADVWAAATIQPVPHPVGNGAGGAPGVPHGVGSRVGNDAEAADQLPHPVGNPDGTLFGGSWREAGTVGNGSGGDRCVPHRVGNDIDSSDDLVGDAVRAVEAARSTWTRYDLFREVTLRLPTDVHQPGSALVAEVDRLVDAALVAGNRWGVVSLTPPPMFPTLPTLARTSDHASVYVEHGAGRYSTDTALAAEARLVALAGDTTGPGLELPTRDKDDRDDGEVTAVAAVLASGRRADALVGAAGTGKTTAMAAAAKAWAAAGRQVLGVSTAETATRVLAASAGIQAVNAAKLIHEHERGADIRATKAWQDNYGVSADALVILDEAGMASRHTLDRLATICATAGAKLLLVGDPNQLPSPDTAGVFELIAERSGATTLDLVHRFTHPWERAASLRLRNGDPSVVEDYGRRGRITGGTAEQCEDAALAAAVADQARGVAVLLLADTNDAAARLAGRVRDRLVSAKRVDDESTVTLADGNRAGAGDEIVTRRNDRRNTDHHGVFVANRDTWTVRAVAGDGSLLVARPGREDPTTLDAAYVATHVQLAYACTVHAAQGATTTICHAVLGPRTTRHGAYVALTRGRDANHAYIVTTRPEGADRDGPPEEPTALLASIIGRAEPPDATAALSVRDAERVRVESLATLWPVWQDLLADDARRTTDYLLAAAGGGPDFASTVTASAAWPALAARLRRLSVAGIHIPAAVRAAVGSGTFDDADDPAAVLHWRLRHHDTLHSDPAATFASLAPTGDSDTSVTARAVASAMDTRTAMLAAAVETDRPDWAAALPAPPEDPENPGQQAAWRATVGVVAGYREAFDVTTPDEPIGPPPAADRVDAHAWWARAAAALTPTDKPLSELPDQELQTIIDDAHSALADAPPPVADRLHYAAVALRAAQTRAGAAALAGDRPTARAATAEANGIARQLGHLEHAQAARERWAAAAARTQAHADTAEAVLHQRRIECQPRPFADLGTADLLHRYNNTRLRVRQAATLAERHDLYAANTAAQIAELADQIERTTGGRPAHTAATRTVTAEQTAAARITAMTDALDATRLVVHTTRGDHRAQLAAELAQLRHQHPVLGLGDSDLVARWQQLVADGDTADQRSLGQLHAAHQQATIDHNWYARTGGQLRAEAEAGRHRVAGLRAELELRACPGTTDPARRERQPTTGQAAASGAATIQEQQALQPSVPEGPRPPAP